MLTMFSFAALTFTSFFPLVDPIGNIPIFNAVTQSLPQKISRYVARRACLFAVSLALGFGFLGEYIFEVFHLTIDGLKIVGGVIFFLMGYEMLNARVSPLKVTKKALDPEEVDKLDDVAITPLGIPLLCGPGVITHSIIWMDKADGLWLRAGYVLGVLGIFGLTFACFYSSKTIIRIIGPNGNRVILRLMGMFVMIIAVNSFFSGLTPIVRNMLMLPAP